MVSRLSNSRPSLVCTLEQVGKDSAAMVCKESCIWHEILWMQVKKDGDKGHNKGCRKSTGNKLGYWYA